MIRGLYTAAAGMMVREAEVDVISNNMANVNTAGYRKDQVVAASFPKMLLSRIAEGQSIIGGIGTGGVVEGVATFFEEGQVRQTGNPFDVALHGNVFFAVRDGNGETLYTRNGRFILDQNQMLVTGTGDAVLGEINQEPVYIYVPGGELNIDREGNLSGAVDANGRIVTRLYLRARTDGWEKRGDTSFQGVSQAPEGFSVEQGATEGSNVNSMEEMVRLIAAMRAYEANSKVIQVTDGTLDKLVNTVGNA